MKHKIILIILITLILSGCQLTPKAAEIPNLAIGATAPEFTLPGTAAEAVSLSDYEGQVVLLNFWATWCGPCQAETPDLQKLHAKYEDQGFVVVGVSIDDEDTVEQVPNFIEHFELTYPILLDTEIAVGPEYGQLGQMRGIPQSYFIDENGVIQDAVVGALEWDQMEGRALRLLDPPAGERRMAALDLVEAGRDLATEGDLEGAIGKMEDALTLDPNISLDEPEAEARRAGAEGLLAKGHSLSEAGQIAEALTAYDEAQAMDPTYELSAGDWNNLCWFGSLWNEAELVLEACELAVELALENRVAGNRDSRGVARALTGDYEGAIEDFEVFVAWSEENGLYEEYGTKRAEWVTQLKEGNNPFDEATLEELRHE